MPIRDILAEDCGPAVVIDSGASVEDAIRLMSQSNASGLIVMEGDRPVGSFTERDLLHRHVRSRGRPSAEIGMRSAMTHKLIVASPRDEIEATLALMLKTGIRHIPVVEEGKIISLINICDPAYHQGGPCRRNSTTGRSMSTTFERRVGIEMGVF